MSKGEKEQEPVSVEEIPDQRVNLSLKTFYGIVVIIVLASVFVISKYFFLKSNISELEYKFNSLKEDLIAVKELNKSSVQTENSADLPKDVLLNYSQVELSDCKEIISAIDMLKAVRISKKCKE